MAAADATCQSSESNFKMEDIQSLEDLNCFGRLGSQLDEKIEFKNKFGENVWARPVIIDFQRVLQLGQVSGTNGVIAGVSNKDLLHAVVALYDISLPDMDTETLYDTVCAKWSRTIVLVQDMKDAVNDMTERYVKKKRKKKESNEEDSEKDLEDMPNWSARIDKEADILMAEEGAVSSFIEVFSDTDEEEEEEEEEEDEDYSKGIHAFITATIERRKQREACEGVLPPETIGIENRLLACATFEKKFIQHRERVIHLTLISVRPRYRKFRMGGYLLSKCIAPTVVGQHEAVVVHADNSAVEFFCKFGFSDDTILNSKWSDLAEAFTNCTLMSYLPGFSGNEILESNITWDMDQDLFEVDHELKKWQAKSREAYQGQLCCMMKLRNEILQLKCLVKSQSKLMNKLITDSDTVRVQKLALEKELMDLRLAAMKQTFSQAAACGDGNTEVTEEECTVDEECYVMKQLESQVASLCRESISSRTSSTSDKRADSVRSSAADVIGRFTMGMESDRSILVNYSITSILKAPDNPSLVEIFQDSVDKMADPAMVTELYYCGSLEKPNRLLQILKEGFTNEDFTHGEFGLGLYFSKYPSKAAQFSDLGKLLEVRVGLGKVETLMKFDRTRKSPSEGFDSVITPGRLYRPGDQGEAAMLCQEYVVFTVTQLLPAGVIYYSANPGTS